MEITIGYILLSLMGVTLGLVGAGGSILTIPILVYLFKVPMLLATTYSLILVGFSACIGSVRYRHDINFRQAVFLVIPSVVGIFIARSCIIPYLPDVLWKMPIDKVLLLFLTTIMLIASYFMIQSKDCTNNIKAFIAKYDDKTAIMVKKAAHVVALGFMLGAAMGLIGAGGGFLIIPVLSLFIKLKMQEAVATSLFIIAINAFAGFLFDRHHLNIIDLINLVKYLACVLTGMLSGIYFAKFIKGKNLKRLFGFFVIFVATFIITKEFIL